MDKKKLIEILQANGTVVNELSKDKAYILQVEVGNMPREQVMTFLKTLSEEIKELGLEKFVIMPTYNGISALTFYEIKDDKLAEVK